MKLNTSQVITSQQPKTAAVAERSRASASGPSGSAGQGTMSTSETLACRAAVPRAPGAEKASPRALRVLWAREIRAAMTTSAMPARAKSANQEN